jgi:hypothetical protein
MDTAVVRAAGHPALMPAARITLAHLSVNSATTCPNSVGELGVGVPYSMRQQDHCRSYEPRTAGREPMSALGRRKAVPVD